jgi:ribosomal protein S18 acetylase RimI-like enzyme
VSGSWPPAGLRAPGVEVEAATWRPVEVEEIGGWRAGFSAGFTRRANSVVAAVEPPDVDCALSSVEAFYAERDLPARFRVCGASRPTDLDARLDARGFRVVATTQVLARDLPRSDAPPAAVEACDQPDDDWLSGWLGVKASGSVDREVARAVVTGSPATYLTLRDADGVVGVIRGAHAGEWVGLSSLMVAPRARRRGVGRALTLAAMGIATASGHRRAFLQVESADDHARVLYEALGFHLVDTYHYRERRPGTPV